MALGRQGASLIFLEQSQIGPFEEGLNKSFQVR